MAYNSPRRTRLQMNALTPLGEIQLSSSSTPVAALPKPMSVRKMKLRLDDTPSDGVLVAETPPSRVGAPRRPRDRAEVNADVENCPSGVVLDSQSNPNKTNLDLPYGLTEHVGDEPMENKDICGTAGLKVLEKRSKDFVVSGVEKPKDEDAANLKILQKVELNTICVVSETILVKEPEDEGASITEGCKEAKELNKVALIVEMLEGELRDKEALITEMTIMLKELESQNQRLRSLRRGVNSPMPEPVVVGNKADRKLNAKDKLLAIDGTPKTPRTPLAVDKATLDSPAAPAMLPPEVSFSGLVAQIERLQAEKSALSRQLLAQTGSSRLKPEGLDGRTKVVRELKAENSRLREELEGLRTERGGELVQIKSEENAESSANESESSQPDSRIEELSQAIKEYEELTGNLQKELCDAKSEHQVSESRVRELCGSIREHRTVMDSLRAELNEAKYELKKTEPRFEELRRSIRAYETVTTDLREELDRSRSELKKALSQLDELNGSIKSYEEQVCNLTKDCQEAKAELEISKARVDELSISVRQHDAHVSSLEVHMREEVDVLVDARNALMRRLDGTRSALQGVHRTLRAELCALRGELHGITTAVINTRLFNDELIKKYRREIQLRKRFYNQLVELKGNIRVMARVRPVVREDGEGRVVVAVDAVDDGLVRVEGRGGMGRMVTFECDKVFPPHSSQVAVFDELADVILSCLDGFNVGVFAYGQTGSGKTFTMEGVPSDQGINQRSLARLFAEMDLRRPDWTYSLTLCMLEIYNESLRDLLTAEAAVEKLEVRTSSEGGLEVRGLTWINVESIRDINKMFELGRLNRTTAATKMNVSSSRSHAVLCVNIKGTSALTGVTTLGKLNLVDLAGSERVSKSGAEGERLKEAKYINRSLSALSDVINALRTRQSHVPYRNSTLTYLLQDSLGGDSKTIMIAQVSPVEKNVGETTATLNFAQRVRSVENGEASKRTTGETPRAS